MDSGASRSPVDREGESESPVCSTEDDSVLSIMKEAQCNQLATREFADDHMGWWHIRASVSVSAAGSLGPQQCLRPGRP